jgi:hypothetical protein
MDPGFGQLPVVLARSRVNRHLLGGNSELAHVVSPPFCVIGHGTAAGVDSMGLPLGLVLRARDPACLSHAVVAVWHNPGLGVQQVWSTARSGPSFFIHSANKPGSGKIHSGQLRDNYGQKCSSKNLLPAV